VIHPKTNKKILQFVAIERLDTNEWAIPGVSILLLLQLILIIELKKNAIKKKKKGMCDPGEKVSNTMRREFMEEALSSDTMSRMELVEYKNQLNKFFSEGVEVNKFMKIFKI